MNKLIYEKDSYKAIKCHSVIFLVIESFKIGIINLIMFENDLYKT
jgi:hypothetical protein